VTYRAVNKVCSPSSTSTELRVRDQDTGVNNENSGARAGRGIVDVCGRVLVSVRNAAETPCSTGLGSESRGVNLLVLLNVGDLKIVSWVSCIK